MTELAASFAEQGLIPAHLDSTWATELLYVLLGPENWHLVRRELGRDEAHYTHWLRSTWSQALAAPARPSGWGAPTGVRSRGRASPEDPGRHHPSRRGPIRDDQV